MRQTHTYLSSSHFTLRCWHHRRCEQCLRSRNTSFRSSIGKSESSSMLVRNLVYGSITFFLNSSSTEFLLLHGSLTQIPKVLSLSLSLSLSIFTCSD